MTSHQQHSQPAIKTPASAAKAPPAVNAHPAFNRIVLLSLVIGLMSSVRYDQPLLAQTKVAQSLTSQVDTEAIKREIVLLGDPDPIVRENARVAIENFGEIAIGELKKAAKFETTRDYETQIVAAKILATLQDTLMRKEAEKFVRGEKELEGWEAFKELTGDTQESRSLFRDIYLRNREELLRATSPPAPGTDQNYTVSYSRLINLLASSDLAQVCFGMFLLARKQNEQKAEANAENQDAPIGPSLRQIKSLFYTLAATKSPLTKLNGPAQAPAILVRKIIESSPQDSQLLSSKLSLVRKIKSKEIGPLLVDFAAPKNPTVIRLKAIEHAIQIADKETFEKLNTYLNDTTEVGKYLVPSDDEPTTQKPKKLVSQVQIRDLILLGNLRLNEQDHTEYGFSAEAIDTTNKFNVKLAGFINNETREKAFEHFRSTTGDNSSPRR